MRELLIYGGAALVGGWLGLRKVTFALRYHDIGTFFVALVLFGGAAFSAVNLLFWPLPVTMVAAYLVQRAVGYPDAWLTETLRREMTLEDLLGKTDYARRFWSDERLALDFGGARRDAEIMRELSRHLDFEYLTEAEQFELLERVNVSLLGTAGSSESLEQAFKEASERVDERKAAH